MKKKIKYTDEHIGDIEIIKDFLPPPDDLIFKEKTVKVTLNLKKTSIDFFKEKAKTNNSQYQLLIRSLLDYYVSRYS